MSTYRKLTKNPVTKEWERATWIDDYYGKHLYGVQFPSDVEKGVERIYDPRYGHLETREDDQLPQEGVVPCTDVKKQRVTYRITHTIQEASASDEKPEICTGRTIEADVEIDIKNGAVTITRIMPSNRISRGGNYTFIESDPALVEAIGQILLTAARKAKEVMKSEV